MEFLKEFEKTLDPEGLTLTATSVPKFYVEKASEGVYYIKISLPEIGDQNFLLKFVDKNFYFSGPLTVIGPNASYSASLFASFINAFVQKWVKNYFDNISVKK